MALELKISQKMAQTLVMTPQLQQAIKLLQLGRLEYKEAIEKELLENEYEINLEKSKNLYKLDSNAFRNMGRTLKSGIYQKNRSPFKTRR